MLGYILSLLGLMPPIITEDMIRERQPAPLRVIVFGATWCGSCRELHAEIERELFKPGLGWRDKIVIVDIDDRDELNKHAVKNKQGTHDVPQVVIVDGDEVVMRFTQRPNYLRIAHVFNATNATRKAK